MKGKMYVGLTSQNFPLKRKKVTDKTIYTISPVRNFCQSSSIFPFNTRGNLC